MSGGQGKLRVAAAHHLGQPGATQQGEAWVLAHLLSMPKSWRSCWKTWGASAGGRGTAGLRGRKGSTTDPGQQQPLYLRQPQWRSSSQQQKKPATSFAAALPACPGSSTPAGNPGDPIPAGPEKVPTFRPPPPHTLPRPSPIPPSTHSPSTCRVRSLGQWGSTSLHTTHLSPYPPTPPPTDSQSFHL